MKRKILFIILAAILCCFTTAIGQDIMPESPLTFTVNGVSFNMIRVRAGTFTMGAADDDVEAWDDEKPAHQVTISYDYFIAETILTQALWTAVMGTTAQEEEKGTGGMTGLGYGDDYPMYPLSYYDCQEFVDSLSKITGLSFRMPTEAEWEYAARGGHLSKGYKYPGSNNLDEVAWSYHNVPDQTIRPVKRLMPNELGLYDMAGNVWEWIYDYKRPYTANHQVDPIGEIASTSAFVRGGSTYKHYTNRHSRVSCRHVEFSKTYKNTRMGFRFVMDDDCKLMSNAQQYAIYDTICSGEIYTWHGKQYSKPGSYTDTLTNIYGCDSIVTLNLEILPDPPISFDVNGVKFNMVRVRAGTFTMGATPEQGNDASSDEMPAHTVTITHDYFMGETMLTQALWTAVMGTTIQEEESQSTGSKGLGYGDGFPMYCLSYSDCLAFVDSLSKITGLTFRLPTEAEWEYAARGGHLSKGYKYPGSNDYTEVAWNINTDPKQQLHEVKLLKPNELGIYDMAGNTWEVIYDYKRKYTATPVSDPIGNITSETMSLRGGSTAYAAIQNRVSSRGISFPKTYKRNRIACRLALDANLILAEDNQGYVQYDTVCLPETYLWNGKQYSKSGSYTDTLTNIYGCDSVVTLHLTVNQTYEYRDTVSAYDAYTWYNDVETIHLANGVSFRMIYVEGGEHQMKNGSNEVVTLQDYSISETEVTQALWTAVMGTTLEDEQKKTGRPEKLVSGDDYPMAYLNWNDCQEFAEKLTALTGRSFRLPTEAEWEYAAKGGKRSKEYKYIGGDNLDDVAWHNGNAAEPINKVAEKRPNELGIYDMNGNIWEHCVSPEGVARGGSTAFGSDMGVAARTIVDVTNKYQRKGIRLVMDGERTSRQNLSASGVYYDTLPTIQGCYRIEVLHFELKKKPEEDNAPSTNREPVILSDSLMFIGQNIDSLTEAERYFNPLYLIVAKGKEHLKNQLVRASVCDCDTTIPNRTIGVFSVAKDRQVTFSQGNLQYFPAANLWKFAASQYEQMGNSNKYLSPTYRNWVDLFGWSADNTTAPFGVSTSLDNADYSGNFVDWGMAEICGDEPGTWRMLTGEEWNYLFYQRQNAKKLYSKGSINGIRGMIILPDDWQLPEGLYFTASPSNLNIDLDINAYTAEEWGKMERAGAVFLPVMGRRDGTAVGYLEEYGGYWVAVERNSAKKHFYFNFKDKAFYVPANTETIGYGRAVRLVQDYKP